MEPACRADYHERVEVEVEGHRIEWHQVDLLGPQNVLVFVEGRDGDRHRLDDVLAQHLDQLSGPVAHDDALRMRPRPFRDEAVELN